MNQSRKPYRCGVIREVREKTGGKTTTVSTQPWNSDTALYIKLRVIGR